MKPMERTELINILEDRKVVGAAPDHGGKRVQGLVEQSSRVTGFCEEPKTLAERTTMRAYSYLMKLETEVRSRSWLQVCFGTSHALPRRRSQ
jgi:hypothetical protein